MTISFLGNRCPTDFLIILFGVIYIFTCLITKSKTRSTDLSIVSLLSLHFISLFGQTEYFLYGIRYHLFFYYYGILEILCINTVTQNCSLNCRWRKKTMLNTYSSFLVFSTEVGVFSTRGLHKAVLKKMRPTTKPSTLTKIPLLNLDDGYTFQLYS